MLEDSLFESQGRKKTRKPVTVVVSAIAHVVTIVTLVLIPLIQTQALTVPPVDMSLWAPKIEPPKPVPESIPSQIVYVDEPENPIVGFAPSAGNNSIGSLLRDLVNKRPEVVEPPVPPPPPPPAVKPSGPIRVSHLEHADLVHQVNPVYPPLARQTRVQGVVVLEALISMDGKVESLRVVTGHPLLTQAALDAVKQWRYRPTMLNGEPIEVITTVTVTFTLQ